MDWIYLCFISNATTIISGSVVHFFISNRATNKVFILIFSDRIYSVISLHILILELWNTSCATSYLGIIIVLLRLIVIFIISKVIVFIQFLFRTRRLMLSIIRNSIRSTKWLRRRFLFIFHIAWLGSWALIKRSLRNHHILVRIRLSWCWGNIKNRRVILFIIINLISIQTRSSLTFK